ncbi:hypothetical protein [Mesorhizobium sp.]|uniref:hypothetical protein n=1 Tax=Mesorhizobium sp. TaxID=1871066 RepID=UPI000FE556D9|nr:hypothetical protein [Mesorhizobium sp.]RWP64142.1 MAG: hypothetical protein EOR07_16275 [Mesorhizobium sp.]
MGRLNPKFAPVPSDFYPMPPQGVPPLLPWLDRQTLFCDPAAGNGALIDHLSRHGHRCVAAFDTAPRRDDVVARDALTLSERDLAGAELFITNLPWSYPVFPHLILHLMTLRPLWTLAPARWAHAARSAALVSHCSHIVCVPRLKWFPDSPHTHTQDSVWLRFDASHQEGPHFYPRETRSADPWATET